MSNVASGRDLHPFVDNLKYLVTTISLDFPGGIT